MATFEDIIWKYPAYSHILLPIVFPISSTAATLGSEATEVQPTEPATAATETLESVPSGKEKAESYVERVYESEWVCGRRARAI